LAFDFEVRAPKRHFTHQTVGARAVKQDRSGPYDFLALGVSLVVHHNRAMPSVAAKTEVGLRRVRLYALSASGIGGSSFKFLA
jgi:hypothetical protein